MPPKNRNPAGWHFIRQRLQAAQQPPSSDSSDLEFSDEEVNDMLRPAPRRPLDLILRPQRDDPPLPHLAIRRPAPRRESPDREDEADEEAFEEQVMERRPMANPPPRPRIAPRHPLELHMLAEQDDEIPLEQLINGPRPEQNELAQAMMGPPPLRLPPLAIRGPAPRQEEEEHDIFDDDALEEQIIQQQQQQQQPQQRRVAPVRQVRVAAPAPAPVAVPVRQIRGRIERRLPGGPIRNHCGRMISAVSWLFVLRLQENDPAAPNYSDPNDPFRLPPLQELQRRGAAQFANVPHPIYIRYQMEQGTNNDPLFGDSLHLQGYLEFDQPITAEGIVEVMGWTNWDMSDIWLANRKGLRQSILDYVWKDPTCVVDANDVPLVRVEEGTLRGEDFITQGARVRQMIMDGGSYNDVGNTFPDVVLNHGGNVHRQITERERGKEKKKRDVKVYVRWGDPGTGKTYGIFDFHGIDSVYNKTGGKWFDGYDYRKHKVLLLDELNSSEVQITDLLKWLDSYPVYVEQKGSTLNAEWETVYITSNTAPSKWYPGLNAATKEALYRRLLTGGITRYVNASKPHCLDRLAADRINDPLSEDNQQVLFVNVVNGVPQLASDEAPEPAVVPE